MPAPAVPHFSDALLVLDFFGIAVFAVSGALVAAERRLDFVTFVFAAALGVWFIRSRRIVGSALVWFDAAGLVAYAIYGSAKAIGYGVAPVPAFAMGVLTACFGGIVRDVLAGEPSILMRRQLYVTAAALAAGLFVIQMLIGAPMWAAAIVAALAGFILRGLAIARGWSLPPYRP